MSRVSGSGDVLPLYTDQHIDVGMSGKGSVEEKRIGRQDSNLRPTALDALMLCRYSTKLNIVCGY